MEDEIVIQPPEKVPPTPLPREMIALEVSACPRAKDSWKVLGELVDSAIMWVVLSCGGVVGAFLSCLLVPPGKPQCATLRDTVVLSREGHFGLWDLPLSSLLCLLPFRKYWYRGEDIYFA